MQVLNQLAVAARVPSPGVTVAVQLERIRAFCPFLFIYIIRCQLSEVSLEKKFRIFP